MAVLTRSQVVAIKKETTEGTLQALTAAADFVKVRAGFSLSNENEVVESEELVNDIGKSASIVVGENPAGSMPLYLKHSGVEGQEPEAGPIYESCMGAKTVTATEPALDSSSTTSVLKIASGTVEAGMAVMIKDATNGYSIRPIDTLVTADATLAFNVAVAPAAAITLGKPVLYKPASSGHPTYSIYRWQAQTSAAFRDAIAGCRTTNLAIELPARALGTVAADFEGIKFYWNYLTVGSTNDDFSFTDDGGTVTGSITQKTYTTVADLAAEIATKMTAASVGSGNDTITCSYSSSTGKFTIASNGSTLSLGCNVANSIFAAIGFGTSALTGAVTYTGASAISYDAPYTPAFDATDPNVIVSNELFIGDATDTVCKKAVTCSLTIGTPKTQVPSICATNGISETIVLERTATFSATLLLNAYEVALIDKSIKNTTTKICFNAGPKDASGNWVPGKCFNLFMQSVKLVTVPVADQDGYQVINLTANGFVTSTTKDVYLTFV